MNVCPVLVGRSAELAELRAAFASGGGLVLVSGEAGIGKTRLLREFADGVRAEGRPVAWARPEAVARSGPYALVADLLDEIAVMLGKAGEEARQLAGALGAATTEPAARPIAARVRGMLGQLGTGLVLMLEDIHLTDELSQAVIAHLARSARDDDVLMVATYRAEEETTDAMTRLLDLLTRDRIAVHVRLAPLDRDGTVEMIAAMWGAPPTDEEVTAISRLGEGIPFFTEELAAARGSGGQTIPETIARAVLTRMQQLSEDARAVVRIASLTEGSIDPAVIAFASGLPDAAVPGLLLEAIRVGLLSDQQGRLAFRHALVREAIHASILSLERAEIHRKLATAIEKKYGTGEDAPVASLARHWKESGEKERAATLYLEAATKALNAGSLEDSRNLFLHVQQLAPKSRAAIDAVTGEGAVLMRLRDYEGALGRFKGAAEQYASTGDRIAAARTLKSGALVHLFDFDPTAIGLLDEALQLLSGSPESIDYNAILISKGTVLARVFNEFDAGLDLLNKALTRARQLQDARLLAEAHQGLAWVYEARGDVIAASLHGEQACEFATKLGDPEVIARAHAEHAARLAIQGRADSALQHIAQAEMGVREGVAAFFRQSLDNILCWIYWQLGRPGDADRVSSGLEATKWIRDYAGVIRVWAAMEAGDSDRQNEALLRLWDGVGADTRREWLMNPAAVPDSAFQAYPVLAELIVRAYGSQPSEPLDMELSGAVYKASQGASGYSRLSDLELHARICLRSGSLEEAGRAMVEAEALLEGSSYESHTATLHELRGLESQSRGEDAIARARFDDAARLHEECSNHSDRARCLRLAAVAARRLLDDGDEIARRLRSARQFAFESGALAEANRCEALLREYGLRPRAGRPKGSGRAPGTLSSREREVVVLLASGASNSEIASRLFLSERTVQDHISNAQRRLGVSGRAALAAWAAKAGLV